MLHAPLFKFSTPHRVSEAEGALEAVQRVDADFPQSARRVEHSWSFVQCSSPRDGHALPVSGGFYVWAEGFQDYVLSQLDSHGNVGLLSEEHGRMMRYFQDCLENEWATREGVTHLPDMCHGR